MDIVVVQEAFLLRLGCFVFSGHVTRLVKGIQLSLSLSLCLFVCLSFSLSLFLSLSLSLSVFLFVSLHILKYG